VWHSDDGTRGDMTELLCISFRTTAMPSPLELALSEDVAVSQPAVRLPGAPHALGQSHAEVPPARPGQLWKNCPGRRQKNPLEGDRSPCEEGTGTHSIPRGIPAGLPVGILVPVVSVRRRREGEDC